ncbi:MAG: hypothetical protein K9G62_04825 [Alphaproteobacteria bacterium]|nr:hypothetical protein [Alphaproteobacteria bacterium]
MLDFGFSELLFIIALSTLLLGPEEIPKVMRLLGRVVRRLQYVRYALSRQFEEFMEENDLADIRKQVNFEQKNFDEQAEDEEFIRAVPAPAEPETTPGKPDDQAG